MNTQIIYRTSIVFMISIFFGEIAFAFWVTPYFFSNVSLQTKQLQTLLGTASPLTYATVVSVDPAKRTIIMEIVNPFESGKRWRREYAVDPSAYIAKQELQAGLDGQYTSLSPNLVSPLSAIQPGDHVAIRATRNADSTLSTDYILFGNPL